MKLEKSEICSRVLARLLVHLKADGFTCCRPTAVRCAEQTLNLLQQCTHCDGGTWSPQNPPAPLVFQQTRRSVRERRDGGGRCLCSKPETAHSGVGWTASGISPHSKAPRRPGPGWRSTSSSGRAHSQDGHSPRIQANTVTAQQCQLSETRGRTPSRATLTSRLLRKPRAAATKRPCAAHPPRESLPCGHAAPGRQHGRGCRARAQNAADPGDATSTLTRETCSQAGRGAGATSQGGTGRESGHRRRARLEPEQRPWAPPAHRHACAARAPITRGETARLQAP
ncbi:uncharacterized protein LOC119242948 [Talpa occidentalis]|uniref:uncharacterized protein LOC119242948 n=1 Tax=Talpa occidentalis TaxID=50954 RepID=UPI00188DD821|nr:uncharacterized protein LOC119242948 [Talpa occidentalis]